MIHHPHPRHPGEGRDPRQGGKLAIMPTLHFYHPILKSDARKVVVGPGLRRDDENFQKVVQN